MRVLKGLPGAQTVDSVKSWKKRGGRARGYGAWGDLAAQKAHHALPVVGRGAIRLRTRVPARRVRVIFAAVLFAFGRDCAKPPTICSNALLSSKPSLD